MYFMKRKSLLFCIACLYLLFLPVTLSFKDIKPWLSPTNEMYNVGQIHPNEEDTQRKDLISIVTEAAFGTGITLYGASLLAYGSSFPYQIQLIVVMRATGFNTIEAAVSELHRNIREAIRSAIYRGPSLAMGAKSISDLQDRAKDARKIMRETKKAKKDGIVTAREQRKITRMKRKQINAIQRDIKRVKRASSSIHRIIQTLDLDEIVDIAQRLMFITTTVLAHGHSDSIIGGLISRYCHFMNFASLALDINRKLGFPIARLCLVHRFSEEDIDDEQVVAINALGTTIVYVVSACLALFKHSVSRLLNQTFIAAAVIMRGLSMLANIDGSEGRVDKRLRGRAGGILAIVLALIGIWCRDMVKEGTLSMPSWASPISIIEETVKKVVVFADTVA